MNTFDRPSSNNCPFSVSSEMKRRRVAEDGVQMDGAEQEPSGNNDMRLEDDGEADSEEETDSENDEEDEENPEMNVVRCCEEEDMDLSCQCDKGEENVGSEGESVGNNDLKLEEDEVKGQMRQSVAKLICFQEVPPVVLKKKAFFKAMNSFFPYLTVEDLDSAKSECLKIYKEEKEKIKHFLNNMDGSISISVDVFTRYARYGYGLDFLCLAAHFIDEDWKLKKWILRFEIHNTPESDFIDDAILKTMKDWNIEHKVSTFTSRSEYYGYTSVSDKLVRKMKTRIEKKRKLSLGSRLFSVRCVAEVFSLMAQNAFGKVHKIINKIEQLHWSKSLSMWHTTNHKLKDALDMQSLGNFDSDDVHKDYDVPSSDEWETIRIVHRLVDRIYKVAKMLFETKYPTANKFLYNLLELRAVLIEEYNSEDSFATSVAKKMLQRLDKYLKKTFLLLAIASVMDPRCKMQYIEYMSTKFEDMDGTFQGISVLEAIRELYADYLAKENEASGSSSNNGGSDKEKSETESWFKDYSEFVQTNSKPKKSDLDLYLEEPVCPWSDDFDTLKWWRSEGPKYPIMAKMARDILAIPLSVAASYDAYYYLENRPADPQLIASGPELTNALASCWSWYPRTIPDLDIWLLAQGISLI